MARRKRPVGRGLFKVLVYAFAVIGVVAAALGTYQYRQIRALYSLINVLSVAERADVGLVLNEERTATGNVTPGDIPRTAEKAFRDLGVDAVVRTR